jgi:hypothetical protein
MSALGQQRSSHDDYVSSALHRKADIKIFHNGR